MKYHYLLGGVVSPFDKVISFVPPEGLYCPGVCAVRIYKTPYDFDGVFFVQKE
jgi:hypothetical protein